MRVQFKNKKKVENFLNTVLQMLLPVLAIGSLSIALRSSGQLMSLSQSLMSALAVPSMQSVHGGFFGTLPDVFTWLLMSGYAIITASFFIAPAQGQSTVHASVKYARQIQIAIFFCLSWLLTLTPIFVHQEVDQWQISHSLSLLSTGALLFYLRKIDRSWQAVILGALLAVILALVLHSYVKTALSVLSIATFVLMAGSFNHYRADKNHDYFIVTVLFFVTAFSSMFSSIFISQVVFWRNDESQALDLHALILTIWWFYPAILTYFCLRFQEKLSAKAKCCMALAMTMLLLAVAYATDFLLLNTLCFLTGMLLLLAQAVRGQKFVIIRRVAGLTAAVYILVGIWNLPPALNAEKQNRHTTELAWNAKRHSSDFPEFYTNWLKIRGETVEDDIPVILLAASGGGLRAAAHAAYSFTAFDDATEGRFGDRVLAISGVSGGALGTATWLGSRADGLRKDKYMRRNEHDAYEYAGVNLMRRFYSEDFISPAMNRFLLLDIPCMIVCPSGNSDRADVMEALWRKTWQATMQQTGREIHDGGIFAKNMSLLGKNPYLPMTIINVTSASDGVRGVYSSVPATFPGARRMDTQISLASAVSHSARFALISPIGYACTDTQDTGPVKLDRAPCRKNYYPIAVADGGYADNSGLASINEILDELKLARGNLKNVFVIVVKSDGSADLDFNEGTRFDNGRLIPELLAPAYVMESARAGHVSTFEQIIRDKLPAGQLISWNLSAKILASIYTESTYHRVNTNIRFIDDLAQQDHLKKQLNLAPLGWTLDPGTATGIYNAARQHIGIPTAHGCNSNMLCKALEKVTPLDKERM